MTDELQLSSLGASIVPRADPRWAARELALGGLFALLLRLELMTLDRTLMSASTYNRMFALHAVVVAFMLTMPAIPTVFGNFPS
jgi:heme/copper-type cytochrome/quinol oxidase subunit 1